MKAAVRDDGLILGGEPRINLLPPEVSAQAADRSLRRKLILVTAGVLVLVLIGVGGAFLHATSSALRLVATQADTTDLLSEQSKYVAVRQVEAQVETALAARAVGGWSEVDWKAYLQGMRAVLPADVGIDAVTVDSTSPLTVYPQPTGPLQEPRVATLTVTMVSPGLPTVPQWLDALHTLPGVADAVPGSITAGDTGGYTVVVTMHIDSDAFSGRFTDATGGN
ncbi:MULTISPECIES: hypothetical protein [unclassified Cryobacterium]|uniref:hypothetical protein n=1 Tax=unclassified Cryobacterium TaxID=2649013 RepID=UPI00106D9A57|nr:MULTISPECIES: hypothetical protein [unclassified Cryobacterium]TFC56946.1 hypothetical protein E3O68_02940 [Cryobacterium sp. TMB3-1-2]TFC67903.1 hypothetical protein E3T21_15740 [Cryobacterium sp. TMB3-15]TFC76822.1 hypothetical protein E3T22_07650 [Cryobacterium sp. TMB3-10]TFD42239.1 hypothetical protein E3T58_09235 [Cryobacterium sp. TMB3-12]